MTAASDPSLTGERVATPPPPHSAPPPPPSTPAAPPTQPLPARAYASGEPPRPHRILRSVLIGLGVFFLVVAVLLPLYVYPRVALLPSDPQQQQQLRATGAKILMPDANDPAGARLLEDVDVTVTNYMAKAPDADDSDDNNVWDLATEISVPGHGMVNARVERISVDPHNAVLTNCCGDRIVSSLEEPAGKPLKHQGYVAWPFEVEKHSYQVWDVNIERSVTANYVGEATRQGIDTYVFKTNVERQRAGSMELPGGLFDSTEPSVDAEAWYTDSKTYYIEPASGNVILVDDDITQEYVYEGKSLTAFDANLKGVPMSGDTLTEARQAAALLPWLRSRASIVLVLLGLAFFVVAFVIGRPRRSKHAAA
ncbi:DUF3068 domain-containing protein [Cryptosporangium sp. NPDC051539]|uniref:DUF3068 domain-containing protein n=1 Tax=Cryptosporangium sp. NPDC051539 TaxID=3363962 RepID=UPI0037AA63BA